MVNHVPGTVYDQLIDDGCSIYRAIFIMTMFFSILCGLGALIDIGLIVGSALKNKTLIYIWIAAQIPLGKDAYG